MVDNLCGRTIGQDSTVACFYFDFAAENEQSPTSMLGALLKQLVCGSEETPEEISREHQIQRKSIGGEAPLLSDIVKMLQTASSEKFTFICVDALDECVARHRAKILDSLNKILQQSPGTRIFVTGRLHVLPEIRGSLAGRTTSIPISPKRYDIIAYLRDRLDKDTVPDAMDGSLGADILKKIPDVSKMYVEAIARGSCLNLFANRWLGSC